MEAALAETGHRSCFPGYAARCSNIFIPTAGEGIGPVPAEAPVALVPVRHGV